MAVTIAANRKRTKKNASEVAKNIRVSNGLPIFGELASRAAAYHSAERQGTTAASSFIERVPQGQAHAASGIGSRQNVNLRGLREQGYHRQIVALRALLGLGRYREDRQILQRGPHFGVFRLLAAANHHLHVHFLPAPQEG